MDLTRNNNKMADEIDTLKNVIEQISNENDQMKSVLDMQQNEWITIEKKTSSNMTKTTTSAPMFQTAFQRYRIKHQTSRLASPIKCHWKPVLTQSAGRRR